MELQIPCGVRSQATPQSFGQTRPHVREVFHLFPVEQVSDIEGHLMPECAYVRRHSPEAPPGFGGRVPQGAGRDCYVRLVIAVRAGSCLSPRRSHSGSPMVCQLFLRKVGNLPGEWRCEKATANPTFIGSYFCQIFPDCCPPDSEGNLWSSGVVRSWGRDPF